MEVKKIQLDIVSRQVVVVPSKAKFLTIQSLGNRPWLLALVNPEAQLVEREIRTYEVGEPIKGAGKYIGVFNQVGGGTFTYISFDEGEI